MIKVINITLVSMAVCFGLFAFMASLVTNKSTPETVPFETQIVEFVQPKKDSKVQVKTNILPPPPQPKIVKLENTKMDPADNNDSVIKVEVPGINIAKQTIDDFDVAGHRDNEARPIVRVAPKYPIPAMRDGKQGWVQLAFSIDEVGRVKNIKVLASEPKRIFNKAAIQALKKWKYKARMVSGKPIEQHNLTVQLDFKIEQEDS
ncbi:TonB family protein [Thalassotalea nanhaiensis]|uniref:Protein TonB n=1 Tax=Thalassotalea nanhaiensis TaxID=3065648 RepID=A0ABY9TJF5_9GAMM|nr:TonB family protein [Colwelliaceae bacterium SQ345]